LVTPEIWSAVLTVGSNDIIEWQEHLKDFVACRDGPVLLTNTLP
jgi:hypothetical protein